MSYRPLADRLIVERIEEDDVTAGGIIIPDQAKEKPKQGKVLAVGPGAKDENGKRIPMEIQVGDVVYFTQWTGVEVKDSGKTLLVMKESDVLAVVA